jgi:hypothetical protein
LVRDVDQWFAHLTFEVETKDTAPTEGPIAIDVGVEVAFADSDGALIPNPRLGEALAPTLAKRQRQLAKKQKGSNNRKKEKTKVAKVHRKLRRQRENFLHTWTHRYAKNHSVVVIEDLKLKNMTRSAKGTAEEPGRNVAQKAGLNRAMLDVAPGRLATMLGYKTARRGGLLIRVPAAYSSQECAECGHVSSENRPSRSEFCCVSCGHEAHADTNAAKVLLQRYTRRTGGEAACGGTLEAGPMKQEPKPARARTKATKTRAKSLGLQASSLPKTIDPLQGGFVEQRRGATECREVATLGHQQLAEPDPQCSPAWFSVSLASQKSSQRRHRSQRLVGVGPPREFGSQGVEHLKLCRRQNFRCGW